MHTGPNKEHVRLIHKCRYYHNKTGREATVLTAGQIRRTSQREYTSPRVAMVTLKIFKWWIDVAGIVVGD